MPAQEFERSLAGDLEGFFSSGGDVGLAQRKVGAVRGRVLLHRISPCRIKVDAWARRAFVRLPGPFSFLTVLVRCRLGVVRRGGFDRRRERSSAHSYRGSLRRYRRSWA